jgi:formylglycine-generating enzyme required for sulfatase activity
MAQDWTSKRREVMSSETSDFSELVRIAGLDRRVHLRFADWSGVDFSGSDLRGFDFTGASLCECNFEDALIEGARFDQAELDRVGLDSERRTRLQGARDWDAYARSWGRKKEVLKDDHLHVGSVFQDAPYAPALVVVPGGRIRKSELEEQEEFRPAFAVGRYAVTFEEWDVFIASGGRDQFTAEDGARGRWRNSTEARGSWDDLGHGRGRLPAVNMSWHDARAYVVWLSHKTGRRYRLLESPEWEYVARAGTVTPYWWGSGISPSQANYDPKQNPDGTGGSSEGGPVPVDRFEPNPWGLYQVHGNVWEWCEGRPISKEDTGEEDDTEFAYDPNLMVAPIRGGGFPCDASRVRSGSGQGQIALMTGGAIGLRVARNLRL